MKISDYNKVTDRILPGERCRREVLDMANRKNREKISRRRLKGRTAAVIIGLAAAVCGGTAAVAAEKIGSLHRLNDTLDESSVNEHGVVVEKDKYDHYDYEPIAQHAEEFTEPIVMENDEYKITVESIYCDGRMLIFGLSGSMKDGNPNGYEYLFFDKTIELPDVSYSSWMNDYMAYENGKTLSDFSGKLYKVSGTDNDFIGDLKVVFSDEGLTEPADVKVTLARIAPSMENWCDAPEENSSVSFDVRVVPQPELAQEIDLKVEDEGFSASVYSITPAMMTVSYSYPRWYDTNDETITWFEGSQELTGPKYSILAEFYNSDGTQIDFLDLHNPIDIPGAVNSFGLQPPTTDTIYCRFYNKQSHDENGNMELIKELELDISGLRE